MNNKFFNKINNLFSIDEITKDKNLHYIYWALLLGFLISFNELLGQKIGDLGKIKNLSYVCPTYFRECEKLYFLNYLPNGYSGNIFYSGLFFLLSLSAFFAIRNKWDYAILFILPATFWKIIATFFLEDRISVPFEYFHMGFLIVLLFSKNKFHMLRHALVVMYFSAGLVKIHEGWILGTYFSTLKLGMPIFPDLMIPYATNFVIILELLTPLLLLSENKFYKYITLFLYILFHIYSISLVGYRYPIHCLPILCILFLPKIKTGKIKSWSNRAYLLIILVFNFFPFLIKGDHKITYEGVRLSLSMFDSNRQCESIKQFTLKSGNVIEEIYRSHYSFVRCTPYWEWFRINLLCESDKYSNISWNFNVSINGEPFYPIVNSKNACKLKYKTVGKNPWINSSFIESDALGYPKKNSYRGPYFDPKTNIIFTKKNIELSSTQKFIKHNIHFLIIFYSGMSLSTLLFYFLHYHVYKHD